jgi:hypothetical protein
MEAKAHGMTVQKQLGAPLVPRRKAPGKKCWKERPPPQAF